MSRDFTPKQIYLVEQWQIKEGSGSLWDFMKNTTISYDGKTFPMHSEEDITQRMQYPLLGKLFNNFKKAFDSLSSVPNGLNVLERCDKELDLYINGGNGDAASPVIKWFEGKLDECFYYGERNEELFLEYMLEEAERLSKEVHFSVK